jgi:exodeoxyribonuclease III
VIQARTLATNAGQKPAPDAHETMRVVAWNCNMALDRKFEALLGVHPDIAIVSECAEPERFRARVKFDRIEHDPVWIGQNPNKGLAVFTFNGYTARLSKPYYRTLQYIAPVHISGPVACNVLAVWAQNASGGIRRKNQAGPLHTALGRYKPFLSGHSTVVAGDLNSNAIWDKPGWRINHMATVDTLESLGLVSAYHTVRSETHGRETIPTLYWRDRTKDGPTYHIDYVFLPDRWVDRVTALSVGTFEGWCGSGLSDHVPIIVDIGL